MGRKKRKYLRNPDLARKYDFDARKCVHIRLFTETKNELRVLAYRMGMTTQDIFERLTQAVIDEDPYIIEMLNEYRLMKENREDLFSQTDKDSVFNSIDDNPFGD